MRILALAPVLPYPATDGLRTVIAERLRGMAACGHAVTLVCFGAAVDAARTEVPAGVEFVVLPSPLAAGAHRRAALLRSLVSPAPYIVAAAQSPAMARRLDHLLRNNKFDLLHIEHLTMTTYAVHARRAHVPALLAAHNVESVLFARAAAIAGWPRCWHFARQAQQLARYESSLAARIDQIVTLSEIDAAHFRRMNPTLQVDTVAPSLDPRDYEPGAAGREDAGTVVFGGVMSYPPNVDAARWFSRTVWPHVLRAAPHARFYVVGKQPVAAVRRLDDGASVHVVGAVPAMQPWLARAQVVVAPLRAGSGVRIKLLEAMAMGKAIVTTTMGAEGLAVSHERELLLADDAQEFAAAVASLLGSPARCRELGQAARALVERAYAPEQAWRQYELVAQRLACRASV